MILHSAFGGAAVALSLASLTTIALAQNVPVTILSTPTAEFPEGYSYIENVHELPDGRVLMLDRCDRTLRTLDFSSGAERQVGRTGSGPGEYRWPARLYAFGGDSSVVDDVGNHRYLIIRPDGTPGGTFPAIPRTTETRGRAASFANPFVVVASDGLGRLYSRGSTITAGEDGSVRPDSTAIERWHPASGKRDTATMVDLLEPAGPITTREPTMPFTAGIEFAVDRDGRIALVDPRDYHVEFIAPNGRRTVGKPIPFSRVRVTEGHKTQFVESLGSRCASRSGARATAPTAGGRGATNITPAAPPKEWPDVLPPFLENAAMFAPDGMLWVHRTGAANDPPAFDVIDGSGAVVQRVVLPRRSRLVGFGNGTVYVVRMDEDDLQYLQRHRLPAHPPSN